MFCFLLIPVHFLRFHSSSSFIYTLFLIVIFSFFSSFSSVFFYYFGFNVDVFFLVEKTKIFSDNISFFCLQTSFAANIFFKILFLPVFFHFQFCFSLFIFSFSSFSHFSLRCSVRIDFKAYICYHVVFITLLLLLFPFFQFFFSFSENLFFRTFYV